MLHTGKKEEQLKWNYQKLDKNQTAAGRMYANIESSCTSGTFAYITA